ncbi:helix-turn-helix domain-containing protein, partial [Micromonospora tulbaghiae]
AAEVVGEPSGGGGGGRGGGRRGERGGHRLQCAAPLGARVAARLAAGATVAATAAEVGLGERALHRRSRALFGYGPKTLARILRMRRALDLARTGAPLAEVAVRSGYADQAHLTREVRELAGVPPTRLLGRA